MSAGPGLPLAAGVGAGVLTVAGGAMDAWVYLDHGHLFANAQTGNVVLLALNLSQGDFAAAAHVLPSVAAFVAGLFCSRVAGPWLRRTGVNSRTVRLLAEAAAILLLLTVVGRLPQDLVTASVGFIAAVQITSLSHIGSASFNTGMTTGNLRGAVTAVVTSWASPVSTHDKAAATLMTGLCVSFFVGAVLGGLSARAVGDWTLVLIAGLVVTAAGIMWRTPDPLPRP